MLNLLNKRVRPSSLPNAVISLAATRQLSLHEYQAQKLLADHGVSVPQGRVVTSAAEARSAVEAFQGQAVLKSQILAGGRGKGAFENGMRSGVHVVSRYVLNLFGEDLRVMSFQTKRQSTTHTDDQASAADAEKLASRMLGQRLITKQTRPEGLPVNQLYVSEKLAIKDEFYLAITVSREHYAPVLLMCRGGGTGIEELAAREPDSVVNVPLQYSTGITDDIVSMACERLNLGTGRHEEVKDLLTRLYTVFTRRDATLLEINPLVEVEDSTTGSTKLMCADTKMTIDNAAHNRQAETFKLRDFSQEREIEIEAEKHGLVYIQLEGSIGCLVNGAGLAMATNDAVAHFGGKCANFLDGGGQATKETMIKAFELILSDPSVKVILVNIYGGIINCDMIAQSVVAAAEHVGDVPVVVRLQGTNAKKGQDRIANSGLKLFTEPEFEGAVLKAIELAAAREHYEPPTKMFQGQMKSKDAPKSDPYYNPPTKMFASAGNAESKRAYHSHHRPSSSLQGRVDQIISSTQSRGYANVSYGSNIANLGIGQQTKVIYQGFTGRAVSTAT
jgi:succinyl-CoA synthetase beta subunit